MMAAMAETRETSLLEDAIDVPLWLVDDRARRFADRVHRDRTLGVAIAARRPLDRVRTWWRRVEAPDRGDVGYRIARARSLATLTIAVTAFVLGASLALAVLRFDGQYPVNVVTALALLAGLPFLLVCTTLLLLPGHLPGFGGLQRALATINAGNLAAAVFNRISGDEASRLRTGWPRGRGGPAARFSKWQLILWSQWGGLCFSTAALVVCFAQVVFTDLAFGWSTTLDVSTGEAVRIVSVIAWPWASFLPDAVPGATLIEESRYFRLADSQATPASAARLTGWWPFLLMALTIYGIAPRLALWVFAKARLSRATRGLLLDHPEVRALLDRMDSTVVDLDNAEPTESPITHGPPQRPPPDLRFADAAVSISWNEALSGADWAAQQLPGGRYLEAGGARGLDEDERIVANLDLTGATSILLFTKAWEPPLLDFQDFLGKLRARLGKQVSIVVVPLGINGTAADADDLVAWDHGVSRLGDPRVYVHELPS